MSVPILVIIVANLIAYLPVITPLFSPAVFTDHSQRDLAGEAINLDLTPRYVTGEITLKVATKTTLPLCTRRTQTKLWPQSRPGLGIAGEVKDRVALDYGLTIPDDPPRFKLNQPNYDQLRVVLWASDSPAQTPKPDISDRMCTKPELTHKVKLDAC
jgi:hypothetical protein